MDKRRRNFPFVISDIYKEEDFWRKQSRGDGEIIQPIRWIIVRFYFFPDLFGRLLGATEGKIESNAFYSALNLSPDRKNDFFIPFWKGEESTILGKVPLRLSFWSSGRVRPGPDFVRKKGTYVSGWVSAKHFWELSPLHSFFEK